MREFANFATTLEREGRVWTGVDLAGPGPDIVVVFVDDLPEEAEVTDDGSSPEGAGSLTAATLMPKSPEVLTPDTPVDSDVYPHGGCVGPR